MNKGKLIFFIVLIFLFSCNPNDKEKKSTDQYKNSKLTIEQIEKKQPLKFLAVEGKDKHNLIGQTVVRGTITNKATIAIYKDISVSISFISKTGVTLEEDEEVIYDEVKPGDQIDFKTKFFAPKGTDDVKMKISKAAPAN